MLYTKEQLAMLTPTVNANITDTLLANLELDTYEINGKKIVNINGPRGFTLKMYGTQYSGLKYASWDSLTFDNSTLNIADHVYLDAAKTLQITPKPYQRTISLLVNFLSGGIDSNQVTYLYIKFSGGSNYEYTLGSMGHTQTTGHSRSVVSFYGVIPANAIFLGISIGSQNITYIDTIIVNGLISA